MAPSGGVLLELPEHHWHCPPCGRTSVTREAEPHAQLHPCPKSAGLLTPYVPASVGKVKVTVLERQDYERHSGLSSPALTETLRRDDSGRPAMGVAVEHDAGAHTLLFVPGINIEMRLSR